MIRARWDKPFYRRVSSYVHLHARRRPKRIAVMRGAVPVSYAALDRDLRAMTAALAALRLPRGAVAAVSHEDVYIHLLLVFGFDSLGVITGSFRTLEGQDCFALLAEADIVMSSAAVAGATCRRFCLLTDDWVAAALAAPPTPFSPAAPAAAAEPAIIVRSSGTTGLPKRMLLPHGVLNARLAKQRETEQGRGRASNARSLSIMHFSAGGTYRSACDSLRLGATFMFDLEHTIAEAIRVLRPTKMRMLPYQLRTLLADLPDPGAAGPLLPGLTMQTTGAKLSNDLRLLTLRKLAGRVVDHYGCSEIGAIATVGGGNTITLVTGVQAEIVDQDQRRVAAGEIGFLRVRGAGMIGGYIGNQAADAVMFKEGWLYPGDLAVRDEAGGLRLVGRRNDVVNLGGIKIAAEELENRILAEVRVHDVAVVQGVDENVSLPVTVFAVVPPATDLARLARAMQPIINFPFHLRVAAAIPRTENGKVKRREMQALLTPEPARREAMAGTAA